MLEYKTFTNVQLYNNKYFFLRPVYHHAKEIFSFCPYNNVEEALGFSAVIFLATFVC